jgi:hypothetical protein
MNSSLSAVLSAGLQINWIELNCFAFLWDLKRISI